MSSSWQNSFSTLIVLVLLCLLGLLFIPFLDIRLNPSPKSQVISVDYIYPGAGPELIELEVTSLLEGAFATLNHLEEIRSNSDNQYGQIQLKFNEYADLAKVRLEVSVLIRQLLSELPRELVYPNISFQSSFDEHPTILVYNLTSDAPKVELQKVVTQQIVPKISTINGVKEVNVSGLSSLEWHIQIDEAKASNFGIGVEEVNAALHKSMMESALGVTLSSAPSLKQDRVSIKFLATSKAVSTADFLNNLAITSKDKRLIYLSDFASFKLQPQKQTSIYRINGQETLTLNISANNGINQLELVKRLKQEIDVLGQSLGNSLDLTLVYDQSEFLIKELSKIIKRIVAALGILLLFIFIIRPDRKYLLLLILSLLAALLLANIGYYTMGLELHLYSIAGWTLSIGIILDNTIMMASHLEHKGNRGIFVAILAATLTTIGALSISFFNEEQFRESLTDFTWVFIINLLASLVVTLFFVPALFDRLGMKRVKNPRNNLKKLRRIADFNRLYAQYIRFTIKYRPIVILAVLLVFGLPFFALPDQVKETNKKWTTIYNKIIDNDFYQKKIKSDLYKWTGGLFYRFYKARDRFYFTPSKREETRLTVNTSMPFGGTQEQLNNILKNLEDQLRNITDLKRFETSIQSANQGSLTMTFSEDGVKAGSHFKMKAAMEKFAIETGGADFVVYGVGQGFSNELKGDRFSVHLQLLGYNYEQLWDIASTIKERLLEQLRIHEVHINSERSYYATDDRYYRAIFRSPAELAQQNISTSILHQSFQSLNSNNRNLGKRHGESIRLTTTAPNDIWSFHKLPNRIETENDSAYFKQSNLLDLRIERGAFNIIRINQQYQLVIEYKFIGNHILSKKVLDEQLDTLEPLLPLGYKINRLSSYSETEEKDWQILLTIVLSMMAIFLICAVLFNSLWQAWVPIVFITPGFMGIFLATILFDFNFDQGGIASFLLVAGLGVNAALFVINDFNLAQKASPQRSALNHYLQAFNAKVMPIIYTNLSTILGLLPFVLLDKGLSFWYALSLCTISGLFLSTLGVLLFLPVIFLKSIPTAA